jgi:LmbE family N-acetylglucosaminyl deacetylase
VTVEGTGALQTFVFFHAHPDDEAIFTGGTIARLADDGHRCIVVYATSGELGRGASPTLGETRREEAAAACAELGVARLVVMDHHDSGVAHDPRDQPWGAFAAVEVAVAADHLAQILIHEQADALVTYDARGVYGHPDHVQVHRVGVLAAELARLGTRYEVTVDREYLHFVDTHVAAVAGTSVVPLDGVRQLGSATVEIDTTVDVRGVLHRKYAAIATHRSQAPDDPTFGSGARFGEVYGWEWYLRHGARTALDALAPATVPRAADVDPERRALAPDATGSSR